MKTCQQCHSEFEVTDQDRDFYKKVSPSFGGKLYEISEPTLCPDCRHQRRLAWWNDRIFYVRKCDKTGQDFVSIYAPDKPDPVYHPDVWWSDDWDPMEHGREFDFSRPFFDQYIELHRQVPKLGIHIVNCVNSYYCNYCGDDKNCYLDIAGESNEDSYFNLFTKYSKDCCDTTFVYYSQQCYELIQAYKSHNVNYSMYCDDSADLNFCYDLKGCNNYLFSTNLRQQSYQIFNQSHSKEEFEEKLNELDLGSYAKREAALAQWDEFKQQHAIFRDTYLSNCENCSGNNLKNCKNTHHSFNATNCEDSKFLYDVLDAKDYMDMNYSLYKPEMAYEVMSTLQTRNSAFLTGGSTYNTNVYYCDSIQNSTNLFGCVGLRQKKYCILNKQYSQEEYDQLVPRIIQHMKETGEWGEFFPAKLSSWGYNETIAMEYLPLEKAQAQQQSFAWYDDPREKSPQPQTYEITDRVDDVEDDILEQILACEKCGKNYKLVAQALLYYRRKTISVPRRCPDCRHQDRIKLRAPRRLFDRTCSNCSKQIQSPYESSRPEQVYCEECYLAKVY